ncbi:glutathione S-transferase [uncultured Rhodoblastus sp.]|uniref:glutathione S-transferase family protein n=1 Tax=uncultured Rhodoblastus sp. TaxID=543037 RepID=UPI0025FC59A1|nr:glutathione S-transferase [uncultured Rhodoblastus sp.]
MIVLCGFGVSNYYNKLKLCMLEKGVQFEEKLVYPWERASFREASPLGRIPFIEAKHGGLSETQAIVEYLEDEFRDKPLFPNSPFARAKCRELLQHLELNVEWVARRLYREAFFGGAVSAETKSEVRAKLAAGLEALARLARFSPFICGEDLTAADCAAIFHLDYVRQASMKIYGEDMLAEHLPEAAAYLTDMSQRPHAQATLADRTKALAAFQALRIDYAG